MSTIGRTFFAYVDEGVVYNPAIHSTFSENITDITLSWSENSPWQADITVVDTGGGLFRPGRKRRVLISAEFDGVPELVFDGRMRAWPVGSPGGELKITALGYPKDIELAKKQAVADYDPDPYRIMGVGDTPEAKLGGTFSLIHWKRKGGPAEVAHLIDGNGTVVEIGAGHVDAGGQPIPAGWGWIYGSLKFEDPSDPITEVPCTITAEWTQSVLNIVDVGSTRPSGAFGLPTVHFYEIMDWGQSWFKPGNSVGDWTVRSSGYRTVRGQTGPSFAGDPKANKKITPAADSDGLVDMSFRQFETTFDLVLSGVQNANRKEIVNFRVRWNGQPFVAFEGKEEPIDLGLSNLRGESNYPEWQAGVFYPRGFSIQAQGIVYTARVAHTSGQDTSDSESTGQERRSGNFFGDIGYWSPQLIDATPLGGPGWHLFFGQPEVISGPGGIDERIDIIRRPTPGQIAINYVYAQACAKIALSARAFISFDCPLEFAKDLEGVERVRIRGSRDDIPGGVATGKVTSITMSLGTGDAIATVRMAVIPGGGASSARPIMAPYVVNALPPVGLDSIKLTDTCDQVDQILAQAAWPAVDPTQPVERTEYETDGTPKPAKPLKGYDLSKVVTDRSPAVELTMSPLQGSLDLPIALRPNGGDGMGLFLWSGPKDIDLEADGE